MYQGLCKEGKRLVRNKCKRPTHAIGLNNNPKCTKKDEMTGLFRQNSSKIQCIPVTGRSLKNAAKCYHSSPGPSVLSLGIMDISSSILPIMLPQPND